MAFAPNEQDVMEDPSQDQAAPPTEEVSDIKSTDASSLDIKIQLTEEQKKGIVDYLEENLPNMVIKDDEERRIKAYFAMYEMAVKAKNFPYEGAPSLASDVAYKALNEWLEKAEVAFLVTEGTFLIDKEETNLGEDVIRRMEKTFHKKFFIGSGFSDELRLILFESGFLGTSIVSVREKFDMQPTIEKFVIKSNDELLKYRLKMKESDFNKAKDEIAQSGEYVATRQELKIINAGPSIGRINQTKFLYPRNTTSKKEWDLVAELEFYTKSDLLVLAETGEADADEVNKAIEESGVNSALQRDVLNRKLDRLPEGIKISPMDVSFYGNAKGLQEYGDTYDQEFATYRVTMKYKLPIEEVDPTGAYRSWIEVIYCPAGRNILSATFCQDGFPYYLVRYRPLPYKTMGMGIAQEQSNYNNLDSDLRSYFLASLEQELGAPLLIRKQSSLWASGYRTYPGAATVTENPKEDAVFMPFPPKSRLAEEGIKLVTGSTPSSNKGAGYNSGKREELLQNQQNLSDQSRMHSISVDLDPIVNHAWKILCRVSQLNTETKRMIPWVVPTDPMGTKLFIREEEMDPNIMWTCLLSAVAMSPDAAFQKEMQNYQIFHKEVPVSVNNPRLSIAWLNRLANYRSGLDDKAKKELLPTEEDFAALQSQLGAQGAAQGGAPEATPLGAQSPNTPFRKPNPQQPPENGAPSHGAPAPGAPVSRK